MDALTPHQNEEEFVRVLTIDVASSAQWTNRTAGFFRDPGEHRTYISFIDPARALRFMNDKRFQIIQLLIKEGPLTASVIAAGACQGTCRLSHAAKGCLSVACEAIVTTDSRSGLRVTAPTGVQSRVQRDQRAGLRSRARTYTS